MKRANLTIIATIIATFVISMVAFQPTATEASSIATPNATPRKRIKSPSINANVKIKKPRVKGCCNDMDDWVKSPRQSRKRRGIPKPTPSPITKQIGVPAPTPSPVTIIKPKKPTGFQEISGIGMEVTSRKSPSRNSAQYNPKEIGVDKTVKRKSSKSEVSMETLERRKQPRKRKN